VRPTFGSFPFHRRLRFELLEDRRLLAITVNTLVDENDGIGIGGISLRDAIAAAMPGETIDFSVTGTINLTHGELVVNKNLTIDGPGANLLTIDASESDPTPGDKNGDGTRVLRIDNGIAAQLAVAIRGLTLTGGDVMGDGGAIGNFEDLTVVESRITGNSASDSGGGVASYVGGRVTLHGCRVSGNSAGRYGGGIGGSATVVGSTIDGNSAAFGGGIGTTPDGGTIWVTNSTISGNSALQSGGGINIFSLSLRVVHSTVTLNRADADGNSVGAGGGINVVSQLGGGLKAVINHAIVAGNLGQENSSTVMGEFAF
jgi:hypothetical protein